MPSRYRIALLLAVCTTLVSTAEAQLAPPTTGGALALEQSLRMLGHNKRALIIGAHPDDEDTELLALLVRGIGAEAAYLSLNRGEGGQNSIGPELGEALGVLRTEELLSARRIDGGRQFFTRAYDFGFSKSLDDTWKQWPRDSVLKDVVRVIRRFRPSVVISVFSGTPRDGHGQHQAAGWAAHEAFRLAGDANAFPELEREEGLAPWTPMKLFRSTRFDTTATTLTLDGGEVDVAEGRSFHQIAMRSRSRHRSQDMGRSEEIGPSLVRLQLAEDRTGVGRAGIFAGIDTTLTSPLVGAAERHDQLAHAWRAFAAKTGIQFDAVANVDRAVPGDSFAVTLTLVNPPADARITTLRLMPRPGLELREEPQVGSPGVHSRVVTVRIAESGVAAQPYFLRAPLDGALYRWPAGGAFGEPFEPPLFLAHATVTLADGMELELDREVSFRHVSRNGGGEARWPIFVLPRIEITPDVGAAVWALGAGPRPLQVTVENHGRTPWRGRVGLEMPATWRAPGPQALTIPPGQARAVTFDVPLPTRKATGTIRAVAWDEGGGRYDELVQEIDYPHIDARAWTAPATVAVSVVPLTLPRLGAVGYVRGPSDLVPEALRAAGVPVRELDAAALVRGGFDGLDAVVIGPRAYETVPELAGASDRLQRFARNGGTVIVQYQQPPFARSGAPPYPLEMAGDRVTEEDAPIRAALAMHPALTTPNRLTSADWTGWIQERGLQFARSWAPEWEAPLAMHDAGEPDRLGALLIAHVGRGHYVYTGLSFFRELPAGVPGAMRLMVNLLGLGR